MTKLVRRKKYLPEGLLHQGSHKEVPTPLSLPQDSHEEHASTWNFDKAQNERIEHEHLSHLQNV